MRRTAATGLLCLCRTHPSTASLPTTSIIHGYKKWNLATRHSSASAVPLRPSNEVFATLDQSSESGKTQVDAAPRNPKHPLEKQPQEQNRSKDAERPIHISQASAVPVSTPLSAQEKPAALATPDEERSKLERTSLDGQEKRAKRRAKEKRRRERRRMEQLASQSNAESSNPPIPSKEPQKAPLSETSKDGKPEPVPERESEREPSGQTVAPTTVNLPFQAVLAEMVNLSQMVGRLQAEVSVLKAAKTEAPTLGSASHTSLHPTGQPEFPIEKSATQPAQNSSLTASPSWEALKNTTNTLDAPPKDVPAALPDTSALHAASVPLEATPSDRSPKIRVRAGKGVLRNRVKLRQTRYYDRFGPFEELEPSIFTSENIEIHYTPPDKAAPRLRHGLESILFNPGVIHRFKDDRTGRLNFAKEIASFPQPREMNMSKLISWTPPSQDDNLLKLALRRPSVQFAGSTSSLTPFLTQLWCLLYPSRKLNVRSLSRLFSEKETLLGAGTSMPASMSLTNREGLWIIDQRSPKSEQAETFTSLLSDLGNIGEKLLTTPREVFDLYRIDNYANPPAASESVYSFSQHKSLLMRSQIDCYHPDLPYKTFDIKTRAVISIRSDPLNAEVGKNYQLKYLRGELESYEREHYDLIRNAFLKYSMQARIGGMDGLFIAHHNTCDMLGFAYWPLEYVSKYITNTGYDDEAEDAFKITIAMAEHIFKTVTNGIEPTKEPLKLIADALPEGNLLNVFVIGPTLETTIMHQFHLHRIFKKDNPGQTRPHRDELRHRIEEDLDIKADNLQECRDRRFAFNREIIPEGLNQPTLDFIARHNAKVQGLKYTPLEDFAGRKKSTTYDPLVGDDPDIDLPFPLKPQTLYQKAGMFVRRLRRISHKHAQLNKSAE